MNLTVIILRSNMIWSHCNLRM